MLDETKFIASMNRARRQGSETFPCLLTETEGWKMK